MCLTKFAPYRLLCALAVLALLAGAEEGRADEGMWLFTSPPKKALQERYGFELQDDWLDHLRLSAVRFPGGSGSFVSPHGLVITNHHVGSEFIDQLSSAERPLLRDGFYAPTLADELRCPDLELNVLTSIEDVTAKVNAAVPSGADFAAAQSARQAAINTIEKESLQATGLKSQVVTLFYGAQYHLYRYQKYEDVRLVFAPEQQIAFFGGDPDNFEYPRYNLDVSCFRVYEDGRPLETPHHLQVNAEGAGAGELVFLVGHPGRTNRLNTVAHLEYLRDYNKPEFLNTVRRVEVNLASWSDRSPENARRAGDDLFSIQNERKRQLGFLAALQDPQFMAAKESSERALRGRVAERSDLAAYAGAWDEIAAACGAWRDLRRDYNVYERAEGFQTRLFTFARQLVRFAAESPRPNAERLKEYSDAALPSLTSSLTAAVPIYPDLETVKLTSSLSDWIARTSARDPLVLQVLDGVAPPERAAALIRGTQMHDAAFRKTLLEGGPAAIEACGDPLLVLARQIDGPARAARKQYEQLVEERLRQAYAKIAAARLALGDDGLYPDATFTLRLAYGEIAGYEEAGQPVAPFTDFAGLYARAELNEFRPPFHLPQRWLDIKPRLRLETPFNFTAKLDHIGGNSGSPVVDRQGRLLGLLFDSNIHGLALDTAYSDRQSRALTVDIRAILESLRTVYGAERLEEELLGAGPNG